ncbi:hypothetical protein JL722_12194 [Aureococcus anophagefferens]|nr:hypothetical protein JL722_12194 [Aureococcus anophagefferens]
MASPRSQSRRHVVVGAPIYEQSSVFGAHVSYAVASCAAQSRGACVCVRRRFTDFRALAASLERRYPGLKGHLPESSLLGGLFADPTEPLKVAPYGEWERLRGALLRSDEDDARVACQTLRAADPRRDEDPAGPEKAWRQALGGTPQGWVPPVIDAAQRVETAAAAAAGPRAPSPTRAPRAAAAGGLAAALRALADAERDVFRDHAKGGASLKRCGDALEAEAAELAARADAVGRWLGAPLHREAVLIGALRREAKRVEQAERKLKPDDDARGRSDSESSRLALDLDAALTPRFAAVCRRGAARYAASRAPAKSRAPSRAASTPSPATAPSTRRGARGRAAGGRDAPDAPLIDALAAALAAAGVRGGSATNLNAEAADEPRSRPPPSRAKAPVKKKKADRPSSEPKRASPPPPPPRRASAPEPPAAKPPPPPPRRATAQPANLLAAISGFDKSKLDAADAPAAPAPGRGPPPMPASNPMAAAIAARRASMRNASDSD